MIALVLGGAETLWEELDAWCDLGATPDVVIAVNHTIARYPGRIDHAVTLHPDQFGAWRDERAYLGGNDDYRTWCQADYPRLADSALPVRHGRSGSSGLFAVQVAQHLGADRIVLCGMPMDTGPHLDGTPWAFAGEYRAAWDLWKAHGELASVRSFGGWTREICGAPTREWLNPKQEARV